MLAIQANEMVQGAERNAMSGMLVEGIPSLPSNLMVAAASADLDTAASLTEQSASQPVDSDVSKELTTSVPGVPSFHAYIHAHAAAHDVRCGLVSVTRGRL